jgi:hypothetical protein
VYLNVCGSSKTVIMLFAKTINLMQFLACAQKLNVLSPRKLMYYLTPLIMPQHAFAKGLAQSACRL